MPSSDAYKISMDETFSYPKVVKPKPISKEQLMNKVVKNSIQLSQKKKKEKKMDAKAQRAFDLFEAERKVPKTLMQLRRFDKNLHNKHDNHEQVQLTVQEDDDEIILQSNKTSSLA